MGIKITHNGFNNPTHNVIRMWVCIMHRSTLYLSKYGTRILWQPSFWRRASPSKEKSNYITLWDAAPPTLWNTVHPSLHLFFFPFLFCFICFLSFLLSFLSFCILTLAEETATMQTKGWQRWAVRFPGIYFPVKTGASPSWDSHTNTLPVSYRPTIRALNTTSISLPGALPCWAEGNIILDILRLVAWGQEPTPTIFPEVWKTPETGNPGIPSTPNPPESLSETGGSMTSHWQ